MSNHGVFDSPHCEIIVKTLIYLNESFHSRGRGGGTWVNFCWVCTAGLSEYLPHHSLFGDQL